MEIGVGKGFLDPNLASFNPPATYSVSIQYFFARGMPGVQSDGTSPEKADYFTTKNAEITNGRRILAICADGVYFRQVEFLETNAFTKSVIRLLDDESYSRLQIALAERPDCGAVIARSGGLRKLRWARKGGGKSGGVRVIYYWWVEGMEILMLDIFPKNEKENVSAAELAALRKLMEEWL